MNQGNIVLVITLRQPAVEKLTITIFFGIPLPDTVRMFFFVVLNLYVNYKTSRKQAECEKKGQLYTNHDGNEIIFRIASQSL